jgi:hypothetical protein
MAKFRLDEDHSIDAIKILATVLDQVGGPTRQDCRLASKALRQVVATGSEPGLDLAARAFASIDPSLRREVAAVAADAAVEAGPLFRARGRRPRKPAAAQATGFLDALNAGGRKPRA